MQGKEEAAKQYVRMDLTRSADRNKDMFVQQADAAGKPVPCYATLNQLAYGEAAQDSASVCLQLGVDQHNKATLRADSGDCATQLSAASSPYEP